MIGVRFREVAASTPEYFALGPVPDGVVIRGVRVIASRYAAGNGLFAFTVGSGNEESVAGLAAGASLVVGEAIGFGGSTVPGMVVAYPAGVTMVFELAVYVPVCGGPVWIIGGASSGAVMEVVMGLVVEPERLVRPAMERGRAARGWPAAGSVLDELRLEAIAARV